MASTFLLILKILGIVISGASAIGSERLKNIETRLRTFSDKKNINLLSKKIHGSFLYSAISKQITIVEKFRDIQIPLSIDSSLYSRYRKWIDHLETKISLKLKPNHSVFGLILYAIFLLVVYICGVFILLFTLMIARYTIFLLSLLLLIPIAFLFLVVMFIVIALIKILTFTTWVVSRPYAWFDFEIQKRNIESTIVVLGIIIAIVAEIIGSYY